MAVFRRRAGRHAPGGPQRQRRTALAELLGSRGMAVRPGEEGRRSRCEPEAGAAPDRPSREAAWEASPRNSPTRDDADQRRDEPPLPARSASPRRQDRIPTDESEAPAMVPRGRARRLVGRRCAGRIADHSATPDVVRPDQRAVVVSASNAAINASGALNRPRRNSGGTTASTASSFSLGSMRR
jgi:hypothetical protein